MVGVRCRLVVAACLCLPDGSSAEAQAVPSSFVTRDSVGVRIVDSEMPDTTQPALWTFSEKPLLAVGEVEGDEHYLLNHVAAPHIIEGGRLLLGNAGAELRWYDEQGRFVKAVGKKGDGPGEFRSITAIHEVNDTAVLVADGWNNRITVLRGDGKVVTTYQVQGETVEGVLDDGRLVGRTGGGWSMGEQGRPGVAETTTAIHVISDEGRRVDTVVAMPGPVWWAEQGGGARFRVRPIPWTTSTVYAVGGQEVAVGWTGRREVRVYDAEGSLLRIIRWSGRSTPITGDDIERQVSLAPKAERPAMRRQLADMDLPKAKPEFSRLLIDDVGNLWVAGAETRPGGERRWLVFNRGGVSEGYVDSPPRFRLAEVVGDQALGVFFDEFDVEQVRVYDLKGFGGRASDSS